MVPGDLFLRGSPPRGRESVGFGAGSTGKREAKLVEPITGNRGDPEKAASLKRGGGDSRRKPRPEGRTPYELR